MPASLNIGLLSPSGWGNLGDDAIMRALIDGLLARWPSARITAFTLRPRVTEMTLGVAAHPITGLSTRFNQIEIPDPPAALDAAYRVIDRVRPWKLAGLLRTLWDAARMVLLEVRSIRRTWRWLATADFVVVAGGGQIDALWGGAWGQPYALARWAWLARLAGVPVVMLSVGVGTLGGALSRTWLRYALRRSVYTSFRDEGSRAIALQLVPGGSFALAPDLAFGLRRPPAGADGPPPLRLGLAPMAFRHSGWPEPSEPAYRTTVSTWRQITLDRLARGDHVHFMTSAPADEAAVKDILEALDPESRSRCRREPIDSLPALLEAYGRMDLVVATRLHAALLALVTERPTVALSYERKVRALMVEAGLADYCLELDTATPADVSRAIDQAADRRVRIRGTIADRLSSWRRDLTRQLDLLAPFLRPGV